VRGFKRALQRRTRGKDDEAERYPAERQNLQEIDGAEATGRPRGDLIVTSGEGRPQATLVLERNQANVIA